MIQLTNIHKDYQTHKALKGVSLTVKKGDVHVLIGPSGCGKSTLLRCINLLEQPSLGTIQIGTSLFEFGNDRPIPAESKLEDFRSRLGMVFQQYELFPHMTALENVMSGPVIVKAMTRRQAKDLAKDLLAKVGLSNKAGMYPRNLSGGQAQRVAIARALAMEPDVILFDEATAALDPELVEEVLKVMRSLADEGKTMIIVTHEMAFARDVANRVSFMESGLIVEEDAAKEIFSNPRHERTRSFLSRLHIVTN